MLDLTTDQLAELRGTLVDVYSKEKLYVEAEEASCRAAEQGVSTKAYARLHRLNSIYLAVDTELNNR